MSMTSSDVVRAGYATAADGTSNPIRTTRVSAVATGDAQGRYYEGASRGNIFSATAIIWSSFSVSSAIIRETNFRLFLAAKRGSKYVAKFESTFINK